MLKQLVSSATQDGHGEFGGKKEKGEKKKAEIFLIVYSRQYINKTMYRIYDHLWRNGCQIKIYQLIDVEVLICSTNTQTDRYAHMEWPAKTKVLTILVSIKKLKTLN